MIRTKYMQYAILSLMIFVISSCGIKIQCHDVGSVYSKLSEDADIKLYYSKGQFILKKPIIDVGISFNSLKDKQFVNIAKNINIQKNLAWITMAKAPQNTYSKSLIKSIASDLKKSGFKRIIFQQAVGVSGYCIMYDTRDSGNTLPNTQD